MIIKTLVSTQMVDHNLEQKLFLLPAIIFPVAQ